jgi:hypothetical protein
VRLKQSGFPIEERDRLAPPGLGVLSFRRVFPNSKNSYTRIFLN